MPGRYWKDSVNRLNDGLDKCRYHLDALNGEVVRQSYDTPNTVIEVSVKTKKKSHKSSHNPATKKTTASHSKRIKKDQPVDEIDHGPNKSMTKSFQNRTLKMFLGNMRTKLKGGDIDEAIDLLGDVEYVALGGESLDFPAEDLISDHRKKDPKRLNTDLRGELSELRKKYRNTMEDVLLKDKQISELKAIVSRVSSNNENMVTLLNKKVNVEESLKSVRIANDELLRAVAAEHEKSTKYLQQLQEKESEICRLGRIIEDLKATLSHDLEEFEHPRKSSRIPNESSNLNLSDTLVSEKNRHRSPSFSDSAIEEGHSETLPPSSSVTAVKEKPVIEDSFKPVDLKLSETRNDDEKSELGIEEFAGEDIKEKTNNNTEKDLISDDKESTMKDVEETYRNNVKSVSESIDEKVQYFLDRLRNETRQSIIPPLELKERKSFDQSSVKIDMSTDLELTHLTEDKFRKGLESSLYLSSHEESS